EILYFVPLNPQEEGKMIMVQLEHVFRMYNEVDESKFPLGKYRYCPQCGVELTKYKTNYLRIQCSNCSFTIYSNPIPAAVVLIEHGDQVLLSKRKTPKGNATWCLPGGCIEWNEDFISAAYREVKEETGVEIEIVSILNVVTNYITPSTHTIAVVLLAKYIKGEPIPTDDITELSWYSMKGELPDLLPSEINMIRSYSYSKYGGIPLSIKNGPE